MEIRTDPLTERTAHEALRTYLEFVGLVDAALGSTLNPPVDENDVPTAFCVWDKPGQAQKAALQIVRQRGPHYLTVKLELQEGRKQPSFVAAVCLEVWRYNLNTIEGPAFSLTVRTNNDHRAKIPGSASFLLVPNASGYMYPHVLYEAVAHLGTNEPSRLNLLTRLALLLNAKLGRHHLDARLSREEALVLAKCAIQNFART